MKEFENYRICGTHQEAMNFIQKLEEQGSEYKIVLGTHPTLGDWTKIEYSKYDPFYASRKQK